MNDNKGIIKVFEAEKLHQKIIAHANMAQENLFEMCTALKEMRDTKLYKEFGYRNFEEYCEVKVGIKHSQASKYISVVEKIRPENFHSSGRNVQSIAQIGVTKLSLLATLSSEEQKEITENVDLENTSVRKLKEEIKALKAEKGVLNDNNLNISRKYNKLVKDYNNIGETNNVLNSKIYKLNKDKAQLEQRVEELESRPVEVAVVENSDSERRLQETIKSLERENIRRNEELEQQYREDEKAVRRMLEQEKQEALSQLTEEYEEKIKSLQNSSDNSMGIFKVWKTIIMKALTNIGLLIIDNGQAPFYMDMIDINRKLNEVLDLEVNDEII